MSSHETGTRFRREGAVLALGLWGLGLFVLLLGARRFLPEVASAHGVGIDSMIYYLLFTTGAMVTVGHVILGYFIWRFSRTSEASTAVPSAKAERTWSLVPALVMTLVAEGGVLALGLPVWAQLYGSESPADAVLVEVVAEQFTWNVRYAGRDGVFGETDVQLISNENPIGLVETDPAAVDDLQDLAIIHLPVDRPAHFRLRSKDVLHSFYLPHQRIKQDAVPGMSIDFWFVPTVQGEFELGCAELCGFGHYQMRGTLNVVSQSEFERWLNERYSGS